MTSRRLAHNILALHSAPFLQTTQRPFNPSEKCLMPAYFFRITRQWLYCNWITSRRQFSTEPRIWRMITIFIMLNSHLANCVAHDHKRKIISAVLYQISWHTRSTLARIGNDLGSFRSKNKSMELSNKKKNTHRLCTASECFGCQLIIQVTAVETRPQAQSKLNHLCCGHNLSFT